MSKKSFSGIQVIGAPPEPFSVSLTHVIAQAPRKKPYAQPRVIEWGSIQELTGQDKLSSDNDGDFTGSGGV